MIARIWPLFFGLALVGLTAGAQGSLLGVRASIEGFDTGVTGAVMSGYYAGFLLGSLYTPKLVAGVGHIRTFGALIALASITVLVHALIVEPWTWFVMRLLSGIAISGIYVVTESWLNHASDDATRGRILSFYMVTLLLGLCCGQFLLNVATPTGYELFTLISILVSVAAIPILLTSMPMPPFAAPAKVSLRGLFRWAPVGVTVIVLTNACFGAAFGMGAVYATRVGMPIDRVALFMAVVVGGGALLQWPLGRLSDHFDRRLIISLAAFIACVAAVFGSRVANPSGWENLVCAAVFGGFCFPLYALATAMINDTLSPERTVAVASTLVLVGGAGATLGPFTVAAVMDHYGPTAFFWALAVLCLLIGTLSLYRFLTAPYIVVDEQTAFKIRAPDSVGSILGGDPNTK